MITLILILIIAYIVMGIVGFVMSGLFWLFILACVLFVITILASFFTAGGRRAKRKADQKRTDNQTNAN